jgi:putative intracellular protease/amidase
MPFRIEDDLPRRGANYVQGGVFKAFVVRDDRLITGQQQYTGSKVGEAVIAALGV